MPVEMLLEIDQQARESAAKTAEDIRINGASDAAMGFDISSKDPAYLDGYFSELRERAEQGEVFSIRWAPVMVSMASYADYEDEF
jgi:hypothetical protein